MKPNFLYIRFRMEHTFQLSGIASGEATQVLIWDVLWKIINIIAILATTWLPEVIGSLLMKM